MKYTAFGEEMRVLRVRRHFAVAFEKSFNQIDEDTAESIMKILNGS